MNVVKLVAEVVLHSLIPGERETFLEEGGFALGLQKDTAYHLSNKLIALPMSGELEIRLPTLYGSGMNLSAADILCVTVRCSFRRCSFYLDFSR